MTILDGKKLAEEIKTELKTEVLRLKEKEIVPGLAVILVGEDEASKIYVKNKEKACQELGINSIVHRLPENTPEEKIHYLIHELNNDKKIHGVLVQLPLPRHIDENKIIASIAPEKDVDCFHPENIGRMFLGNPLFFPCTPEGILELLKKYEIKVSGKDVLIIGKSNIVGKPLAFMLANQDATATLAHLKTKNLKEKTLTADIIVSATGRPGLITADMIKQGAVIVDVGMNWDKSGRLSGDADFSEISEKAGFITPVPGGVGPMTVACLMRNVVKATQNLCN